MYTKKPHRWPILDLSTRPAKATLPISTPTFALNGDSCKRGHANRGLANRHINSVRKKVSRLFQSPALRHPRKQDSVGPGCNKVYFPESVTWTLRSALQNYSFILYTGISTFPTAGNFAGDAYKSNPKFQSCDSLNIALSTF